MRPVTRDIKQMISSRFLKNKPENSTDIRNEWSLETLMLIKVPPYIHIKTIEGPLFVEPSDHFVIVRGTVTMEV